MHKITNTHNLPEVVVKAIEQQNDSPVRKHTAMAMHRALGFRPVGHTTLLKPPQHVRFGLDHNTTEDARDGFYALFGGMLHSVLEVADLVYGAMSEHVFGMPWTDESGIAVTAQPDLLQLNEDGLVSKITDFKTTSVWEYIYGMRDERVQQVNMQRFIVTCASAYMHPSWEAADAAPPHVIDEPDLSICYFFRDWRASEAARKPDYPQSPVIEVPVERWSMADTGIFIGKKVDEYRAAEDGNPRPCTDEERWHQPGQFKVFSKTKDGKKWKERADRVVDTRADAMSWLVWKGWIDEGADLPDHIKIEHEPGSFRRCEPKADGSAPYCPFVAVCDQANQPQE